MRDHLAAASVAVVLLLAAPVPASAEWVVTPYAGVAWQTTGTFNDAIGSYDDEFAPRLSFGGAGGWRSGPLTLEFDFGYMPDLFGDRSNSDDDYYGTNRVMTLMANGLWSAPYRLVGLQPYAAGGIGVIRTHVANDFFGLDNTNIALDVGGGLLKTLGARYGLRLDARYFRTIQEQLPEPEVDVAVGVLKFWRFSGGVTIRF